MKTINLRGDLMKELLEPGLLTKKKRSINKSMPTYGYSVRQLCGYDRNGEAIYEGDVLIDQYGEEYELKIQPKY